MALKIASLNSGSNGNCYYIGNDNEAVLVDAGLSCKETERRMKRLNLSMKKIKAIFVSHEHIDHVRGLAGLSEKFSLPVYVTDKTKVNCYHLHTNSTIHFDAYSPIHIGDLSIVGFPKLHDAVDAHSFNISCNGVTVGVFTDIGEPCEHLIHHFKKCNAVFLEANYDEEILENGKYPFFLKNRIRGRLGHLSNKQALDLFLSHRSICMSHVLLSHLSKDNNDSELVRELFSTNAPDVHITVASRYEESKIFEITKHDNNSKLTCNNINHTFYQTSLF
jgi:phosphoribosyl 1,2-cyclic phosphodiesterase